MKKQISAAKRDLMSGIKLVIAQSREKSHVEIGTKYLRLAGRMDLTQFPVERFRGSAARVLEHANEGDWSAALEEAYNALTADGTGRGRPEAPRTMSAALPGRRTTRPRKKPIPLPPEKET